MSCFKFLRANGIQVAFDFVRHEIGSSVAHLRAERLVMWFLRHSTMVSESVCEIGWWPMWERVVDSKYVCVTPFRLCQRSYNVNANMFHWRHCNWLHIVLRLRRRLSLAYQTFVTSCHPLSDRLSHAFPHKPVAKCAIGFVLACVLQNRLVTVK